MKALECFRVMVLCGVAASAWPSRGVATETLPPAAAFARLPDLSLVRLTPDGKTVAWAGYRGDKRFVFILDLAAGKYLREIQADSELKLRDLDWADNRSLLLTLSRTSTIGGQSSARRKYEFSRTIAFDSDGGQGRVLLMDDPDRKWVTGAELLRLHTGQPETILMSSWDFQNTAFRESIGSRLTGGRKDEGWLYSLFEVNTRTGVGKTLASGTPFTQQWIVDARGRPVARSDWNPGSSDFRVLANDDGSWKVIYRADNNSELQPEGVMADGKSLIALGARGGNRVRAWQLPLDGSEITLLFEGDEDVEGIVEDRFTGAPAGLYLGGLEPTIHWLDPKLEAIRASLERAFPGSLLRIYDRSQDYGRVLTRIEGASSPPIYYLIDLVKGTADIVGEAYPELVGVALGAQQAMHFKARDDVMIPAYLTLPPGREPLGLPLVVLPHGGPSSRDDMGFDWWAQFLATRGYVVLQPQFRGSTGFGADLQRAGAREWGRAMQDDISDGIAMLVGQKIVDASRICIVGASYGGYAALAGAAFSPGQFACAVSVNGIANLPSMIGYLRDRAGDESNALAAWHELVGRPYEEDLASVSPAKAIEQIRAPILLIHGTDDTVVPFSQSDNFARLLKQHGKPHALVKLKSEDHWLSTSAARLQAMQAIEAFLAEHLRSKNPPVQPN